MTAVAEVAPAAGGVRRPPATGGVSGLAPFTWRLTRARLAARSGEGLLYGASIVAATVSTWILLTLAGGTWMFRQRQLHPTGILAEVVADDPTAGTVLTFYVGLALTACGLVLPAIVSLAASGAQLGARGRERRLASLRLLGLSSGDVTRMALLDALVQALVGAVLGSVVYAASLPAWGRLAMQATPVAPREMLLPAWLWLALLAGLVLLVVGAAAWGLRQVRISPLGVARRANTPAARAWRLVIFVVILATAFVVLNVFSPGGNLVGYVVTAGVMLAVLGGANLAGPWLVQQGARLLLRTRSASILWAARRVIASPRATWGRTASLGLLAFIGGYLGMMPISYGVAPQASQVAQDFMTGSARDFSKGALITLALGFVVTATAMLIGQASATIERAEQSRALHRIGAPQSFSLRVMWLEAFAPILLSVALSTGLGVVMSLRLVRLLEKAGEASSTSFATTGVVLGAGLVVTALALVASHPLHRRLLGVEERRAD